MFTWEITPWVFKGPNPNYYWILSVQGYHAVIMKLVIMKEMSWLFKDPIVTVAWLNFDHVQSNSKKWPTIIQMKLFLEIQLIKFSCTYDTLLFCKILKIFLEPIQSYEDVPFLVPKWLTCPEQFFFVQTIIITFIYLLGPFIEHNLKKILIADPELWGCTIFGTKMAYLSQFFFLEKNINIIFIYLLAPFLGTKWLIFSNENFFRRPVNKLCSFHTCLSACQKPKSDINLLTLAESHFWL